MDEVLLELGAKWNTLDRNSQRYIATIAAGSRQQSRFIALMENYERTMELVDVAQNSAGKSQEQFAKFSDSTEYKVNKLKNTWEQVRTSLFKSEDFNKLLEGFTGFVEKLQGLDLGKILVIAPMALVLGRTMASQWIKGFSQGLEKGKGLFNKVLNKFSKDGNTKIKIQGDISDYEKILKEAEIKKKEADLILGKDPQLTLTNSINALEQAEQEAKNLGIDLSRLDDFTYEGLDQEVIEAANNVKKLRAEVEQTTSAMGTLNANKKIGEKAQKELDRLKKEQFKSDLKSGFATSIGQTIATGAMMAFTENFDLSEIAKTTSVQNGISALSSFISGNFAQAAAYAATTMITLIVGFASEQYEKWAEKRREENDKAYKISKQIEKEKEKQEELNEKLDEANQKYDKANKEHQKFQKAVDTYEELSKKILLTEEEQEELNSATQELIDLHPELVVGYDDAGNAILKMGSAWDEVIKKEKESFQLIQEMQNQAEISAFAQNYKVATEELEHANEVLKAIQELPETENTIRDYGGGISGAFKGIGAWGGRIVNAGLTRGVSETGLINGPFLTPEDYEKDLSKILSDTNSSNAVDSLKDWIEENRGYSNLFLLAINEITDENYTNIDNALSKLKEADNLDKFTKKLNEYLEAPEKAVEDAQRKVKSLELINKTALDEFKKSANNSIKNLLDTEYDLSEFSEQQNNILEQLINISLLKDGDKIQEAMTADDGGWSYLGELASSKNAQQIVEELKKVSPAAQEAISDYYKNLYTRSQEENTKILHQIVSDYNLGEEIEKALTETFSEAQSSWQESYDKIAQVYGAGFENSNLSNVLSQVGAEGAANFANAFAEFDTNPAAQQFLTGLEEHLEQYGDIPAEVISQLVNYNWADLSYDNLAQAEQEFVDYVKTLGINEEKAKEIWEDYKDYLNLFDVTNLTPTSLTVETLEEEVTSKLADKVSAGSSLATAIESQLKNGFLTFSESAALEEACTKIGLDASKYINYSLDGNITLDTEGLKEGLEEQRLSEDDILEEVRQTALEKQDQLRAEYAILKATNNILDTEIDRRDVVVDIAKEYWDIAAAMAAASGDSDNAAQYLANKDKSQLTVKNVNKEDVETRMEAIQAEIDALDNVINSLDKNSEEYKKLEAQINATYNEIEAGIKEKEEAITETVKANIEARDKAYEDWSKQVETVNEKTKALAETIQGTEWFDAGIDPMYNYTTALERVSKAADKAKTALTELNDDIDPQQAMDKYLDAIHQEAAISEAEARTYAKAIANGQKVVDEKLSKEIERINKATGSNMSTDVSGLYKLYGDRYSIDINRLNSLNINDEFKKMLADEIKSWNDNLDKIEELEDKRLQRIKEFKEAQKSALQGIVNLQEEMKNALKEKYEQEIEDIENKYKAMEEADNDYVSALEESIKRQRELRERETQWNDLADKERKLSLMQRDTSGGNLVATRQLEKEVQTDRQKLLDDSVDDIIDGLKEMYELQKESREAEIEYRKALLDDGMLMQEVAAALEQIHSADDLVAWFESVTDVSNMSKEQLELERLNWEEMYEAKEVYLETSTAQFEEALMVTEEDIQNVVTETSETLTTMADQTLEKIGNSVEEAIKKAQEDLEQARKDLQEKWEAYLNALEQTAKDAANQNSGSKQKYTNETAQYYYNTAKHGVTRTSARLLNENEVVTGAKIINNQTNETANWEYLKSQNSRATNATSDIGGWGKFKNFERAFNELLSNDQGTATIPSYTYLRDLKSLKNNEIKEFMSYVKDKGYHIGYVSSEYGPYHQPIFRFSKNKLPDDYIYTAKYAKGGLVDYTGPAWVDGTKSKPEAFLSAEDTKRIGEAAKILAQLPLLNSEVDKNNITNNSIGDTTINLNLTVENISSDYDVDQAVERVKKDIVEAAKYRGSNVILNKRV